MSPASSRSVLIQSTARAMHGRAFAPGALSATRFAYRSRGYRASSGALLAQPYGTSWRLAVAPLAGGDALGGIEVLASLCGEVDRQSAGLGARGGALALGSFSARHGGLGVTDVGRIYSDHCIRILAEVEDANRAVTNLQGRPRGLPPITVPASTQVSSPFSSDFLARCSEVQLEVLSRTGTWTGSKDPSTSPPAVAIQRRR
jgi:hypothetical protein